eukprot:TRINITY_DN4121_c0_g1_i1.p1 TRINITY_DN4121_c0_g1~~TRINITY_DN4121_c0_g1_i1.p1  ORF type:complete len:181 (-),score=33.47 TRINITY_DN4121_c0_g1_i1:87-587(-)
MGDNTELFDELHTRAWVHHKKIGPIFATKLTERRVIQTLEGTETGQVGDMLCRGVGGELWPQKEARLLAKYKPTNTYDGEWRKYIPDPKQPGVFAARVPHPFAVRTSYGVMRGKAGDYLLKDFADKDDAYPANVWVVDRKLFNKTYTQVLDFNTITVAANIAGIQL